MGRTYSLAFKHRAIGLLAAGMPVKDAAALLEMPGPTLWRWKYEAIADGRLADAVDASAAAPDPQDPLVVQHQFGMLEQRLQVLEEELALLGKVSAFLATERRR